ncbi:MAG: hypothetical protein K1X29_00255 [Bdellovibrionales bacterium]|nr:hypothetical protein [Bdellovibrionales bacterium]
MKLISYLKKNYALFLRLSWTWKILWSLLFTGVLISGGLALSSRHRLLWQAHFFPEKKELLAVVNGDLLGNGSEFKVLKYATRKGLIIEIQSPHQRNDNPYQMVDRVFIPDRHDGYFSLSTASTQLAILDINGDGVPEIIAPSFDENLMAHLNPMRLDPITKKIQLIRPEEL